MFKKVLLVTPSNSKNIHIRSHIDYKYICGLHTCIILDVRRTRIKRGARKGRSENFYMSPKWKRSFVRHVCEKGAKDTLPDYKCSIFIVSLTIHYIFTIAFSQKFNVYLPTPVETGEHVWKDCPNPHVIAFRTLLAHNVRQVYHDPFFWGRGYICVF